VSSAAPGKLAKAVEALCFVPTEAQRLFAHPCTQWLFEFSAGPLGFGAKIVNASGFQAINTAVGPFRVITQTYCVMDRLTAFLHWRDRQCYDQAIWMAQSQVIDWADLETWAANEGMPEHEWQMFFQTAKQVT
jgi:hypothetical protein